MVYRTHIPQPPLSDFVNLFWFYGGYDPPHARERILPTGTIELVINLREDETRVYGRQDRGHYESFGGAVICGAHSGFFVIDTAEQASTVGVHFKPGGAFPFLDLPAGELRNSHASLESLWGSAAVDLRERLLGAGTPEAAFRILERTLLARTTSALVRHPAVAFALSRFRDSSHPQKISDVTAQIGLSQRRFVELFDREVGLTPKLFCRVRRFQEVLRVVETGRPMEWAEVALDCGYFDQAHFVHDFREFSGLNPTAYLAHRGEHLNHVPLGNR